MKTIQILSVLFVILFVSCNISSTEDFVVGENFIVDKSGVMMIDTLTIRSSSVKLDSIISNSSGRFLVGSNYNSFSGYKNSNTFMEMMFDDAIDDIEFVFDSICLVVNYDTYYFGDTTITQTLKVHQLQEEMELGDDTYLYTSSKFPYEPTPLGSIILKPRPNSHQAVSIRLTDRLGVRLEQMIKSKKDTITSSVLFKKFFKGLVITSQSDVKGAVFGFRSADAESSSSTEIETKPEIRLYYHLNPNPDDLQDLYYKFAFNTDGISFNQISENISTSLIDGISDTDNEKSSDLTNKYMFVQSGIQIFSKLEIPYLENLLLMGQNSAFIGATLRLFPVKGTYSSTDNLPDSLSLYSSNRKNYLIGQIYLPGSTSDYAYAKLTITKDVEETVYYEADISNFIDSELKEQLETNSSLMIGYDATIAKKTAEHVIWGGSNSGKYSPELKIYYFHN